MRLKTVKLSKKQWGIILLVATVVVGAMLYAVFRNEPASEPSNNEEPQITADIKSALQGDIATEGRSEQAILNDLLFRAENYVKVNDSLNALKYAELAEGYLSGSGMEQYMRLSQIFAAVNQPEKAVMYIKRASDEALKVRNVHVQLQAYAFFKAIGQNEEANKHLEFARTLDKQAVEKYEADQNKEYDDGPS